jgi:hydroxymethylpyrimidine pyrophosphatase-like HAD family hydrolase
MLELARGLPMVRALVSCQGCEVSDAARERIFVQEFLPPGVVDPLMRAGTEAVFGVVAYTDEGEHVLGEGPDVERYRRIVGARLNVVPVERFSAARVHKVMWIGSEAALDTSLAHGVGERCRSAAVETVRSHREVFEFVPRGVNKATGTAVLAKRFGLAPQRVAAFGDAENDLALFDWAGLSVAMPHAGCEVRRRATITAPAGCAESAFARGVDALLASTPSGSWNGRLVVGEFPI